MPNADRPNGFRPVTGSGRVNAYPLAAANSIIGKGDLLERTSAGVVDRASTTSVQIVGVAAAGAAASSGGTILVWDDPNAEFVAQTDNGTGVITTQTGVNLNAAVVVTDAVGGISREEIDESTGATTATLPLNIIKLYSSDDNAFGEFNRMVVTINNHVHKSTGTAGV